MTVIAIHVGPIGSGKSHSMSRIKFFESYQIEDIESLEHLNNAMMSYSKSRKIHLDIWITKKKFSLSKYMDYYQQLPCKIYIETRNPKHLDNVLSKSVVHNYPTTEEKTKFLFKILDKNLALELSNKCITWYQIHSEIEKSKHPHYIPFDYRQRKAQDLSRLPELDIGLYAIRFERTRAKKMYNKCMENILYGKPDDTCSTCGQFRAAHKNQSHPFRWL